MRAIGSRLLAGLAVLLAVAAALAALPLAAARAGQPLACAQARPGGLNWQRTPLPVSDPTGIAVEPLHPNRLLLFTPSTVYGSDDSGCTWLTALSLDSMGQETGYASATASIVAVAYGALGDAVALVSEGSGSATRPHVLHSPRGLRGTWSQADSGLPALGRPQALTALSSGFAIGLAPVTATSSSVGLPLPRPTLPQLPTGGSAPAPDPVPALVYVGRGTRWSGAADSAQLGDATGVEQLAAGPLGTTLYAVAGGRLWVSADGGSHFTRTPLAPTPRALAPTVSGGIEAVGDDFAAVSVDGGRTFHPAAALPGARAAAWRPEGHTMVVSGSKVALTDGRTLTDVTPRVASTDDHGTARTLDAYPGGTPRLGVSLVDGSWYLAVKDRLYRWYDSAGRAGTLGSTSAARSDAHPPAGQLTPPHERVVLASGASRVVPLELHLPPAPTPVDVEFLVDISQSMGPVIEDLQANVRAVPELLRKRGIDVNAGVGSIGTAPNTAIGVAPDPPADPNPNDPPYRQPVLYHRWAPVGAVGPAFYSAVGQLLEERYLQPQPLGCDESKQPGANKCDAHNEGQLIGLEQVLTGSGVSDPRLQVPIPAGQQAQFRDDSSVRRIVVLATDEPFRIPPGTPTTPDGLHPDIPGVAAELRAHGISVIGFDRGQPDARPDLQAVARLTGAVAPPGGIPCAYGDSGSVVPAGEPIVCEDSANFSNVIATLLAALRDVQPVTLSAAGAALRGLDRSGFAAVDVKHAFDGRVGVGVSCAGRKPGTYRVTVRATLRGAAVASAVVDVVCAATRVAVPPLVAPPPPPPAPDRPPALAPAGVTPPQPVSRPPAQSQPQANPQVNPNPGFAAQQEEQLQLALAQAAQETEDPGPATELAMSRRREERSALALVLAAMAASSGLGSALQRRRSAPEVAPVWARDGNRSRG